MNITADIAGITLPPPSHIGIVVKNIDETIDYYTSGWGISSWNKLDVAPAREQMLVGDPFRLKIAVAPWGPVLLELLQPMNGETVWSDFLETNGEGIHHLCFDVSDWNEVSEKLKKQGARMIIGSKSKKAIWCYFETTPGGVLIEIRQGGSF